MRLKRLVSAILAVSMALTILPTAAFAAASPQDALTVTMAAGQSLQEATEAAAEASGISGLDEIRKLTVITESGAELTREDTRDDFRFLSGVDVQDGGEEGPWGSKYNDTSKDYTFLKNLEELDLSQAKCKDDTIPSRAFYENPTIKKLVLPETLKVLKIRAISGMKALTCLGPTEGTVYFPDSITILGESAVANDEELSGELHLPASLEQLGSACFNQCKKVTGEVVIGSNVSIKYNVFNHGGGCSSFFNSTGITKLTFEPSTKINAIDASFALNCKSLKEVVIPDTITSIGSAAFSGTGLTKLPDMNEVTTIGEEAFANITSFTNDLVIPAKVTKIGTKAFNSSGRQDGQPLNIIVNGSNIEFGTSCFGGQAQGTKIYFTYPVDASAWTIYYNITVLDTDGGTVEPNSEPDSVTGLCTPVKEGRTFAYWVDENGNKLEGAAQVKHTYTAKWGYEVKFDTNGYGTKPDSLVLEEANTGLAIDSLPTLTAEDMEFEGWYTDAACSTKYNGEAITQNTTLYAKWKIEDGKLIVKGGTFAYGDAEAAEKGSVPAGSVVTVTLNDDFENFDHWDIQSTAELEDENGNKIVAPDAVFTFVMPEEGVILTAAAKSEEPDVPEDVPTGKGGGTDALQSAVIVGAAAAGTAVLVYSMGTRLYLNKVLPAGTAIPTNRAELALLVWNAAGRPEPAAALSADAAETDKAIAWAVENDLLKAQKINGKAYAPTDAVSRLDVIRAWNKVQERS